MRTRVSFSRDPASGKVPIRSRATSAYTTRTVLTMPYCVLHCTHQPGKAAPGRRIPPLARGDRAPHRLIIEAIFQRTGNRPMKNLDPQTRTELEAAAFRRLLSHLRNRTDVQNIDMMNLTGFCRNCLSNWLKDAADEARSRDRQGGCARARLRHALRGVEETASGAGQRRTAGGFRGRQARALRCTRQRWRLFPCHPHPRGCAIWTAAPGSPIGNAIFSHAARLGRHRLA